MKHKLAGGLIFMSVFLVVLYTLVFISSFATRLQYIEPDVSTAHIEAHRSFP